MTGGSVKRDGTRWMFVVDLPGPSDHRKQVRRRGFATKKEAHEELTRLRSDVQRGTFVQRRRTTVGEYLEKWLVGRVAAGRRASTIDGYRQTLHFNLVPALGSVELQALRPTSTRSTVSCSPADSRSPPSASSTR
jgi:integrase